MTTYRASEAITHWRHLTIIATAANVNGTPVADEDVSTAVRQTLLAGCQDFTRRIIEFSQGMCWMQHDIFWFPAEWTEGTLYEYFEAGAYVTAVGDTEAPCAEVGMRTIGYDTLAMMGPSPTYGNTVISGLSDANADTFQFWMQYALNWTTAAHVDLVGGIMTHEFSHLLAFYFGDRLGHTMPYPDAPANYEHLDGTPLGPATLSTAFLQATYSGNIQDIATQTPQGCTPEVWAVGPVRKVFPR